MNQSVVSLDRRKQSIVVAEFVALLIEGAPVLGHRKVFIS
jgi:hypothetical protein